MNSACLSTNLSISHGHATLSTRGCSRVIHFMVVLPKHLLLSSVASQRDSGLSHKNASAGRGRVWKRVSQEASEDDSVFGTFTPAPKQHRHAGRGEGSEG